MGRGDKRTFKGKVFRHSFGKSRPRTDKKTTGNEPAATSSSATSASQQQRKR